MWNTDVEEFVNNGKQLTVSLGGRDLIVNTEAVGRYLVSSGGNIAGASDVRSGLEHGESTCSSLTRDSWKRREWKGCGMEVLWFEHLDHGQVFEKSATRARLCEVVQKYCKGNPSEVQGRLRKVA